jgi:hypothetical protein
MTMSSKEGKAEKRREEKRREEKMDLHHCPRHSRLEP